MSYCDYSKMVNRISDLASRFTCSLQWYNQKLDPTPSQWGNARIASERFITHLKSQGRQSELWDNIWALVILGWPYDRDEDGQEVIPTWTALAQAENVTLDLRGKPPRWYGVSCEEAPTSPPSLPSGPPSPLSSPPSEPSAPPPPRSWTCYTDPASQHLWWHDVCTEETFWAHQPGTWVRYHYMTGDIKQYWWSNSQTNNWFLERDGIHHEGCGP